MRKVLLILGLALLPLAALAHVNSPDVFYDAYAGPYHLLVTVRPAPVVPGVAQVEIRSADDNVEQIKIVPLRMLGAGANLAPVPDLARRDSRDPRLFNGKLWLMDRGSWKVQVEVQGKQGPGELAVPVPAVSTNSARMQKTLGGILGLLGLVLFAGFVSIIGAAARDGELAPGETPGPAQRRRGYARAVIAAAIAIGALLLGNAWWGAEAAANAAMNYKLPHLQASLQTGNRLRLQLENPNRPAPNRFKIEPPDRLVLTDLVPDHGHIMHLFLVSMPEMKIFWHLHPSQEGQGQFTADLPTMPAGRYQIYADIVHRTGFPETQVGAMDMPAVSGAKLNGDDSGYSGAASSSNVAQLSNGDRMVWERDAAPLKAGQPIWFRFRVEDKNGNPVHDLENYMGMAGHAAFISSDGKVFAHIHPAGSVPMAAVTIAESGMQNSGGMAGMERSPTSAEVSFPYGFPRAGEYHLFVQIKRAGKVETGAFLARAE